MKVQVAHHTKTTFLEKIARWMIPTKIQQDEHTEEYRKARLICFSLLIVSMIPIAYSPFYWFISYYWGIYVQSVVAVCCISVILYYRKFGQTLIVGNFFSLVAYLSVICLAFTNRSFSGILWLTLTPVSAFLLANYKSGQIWGLIVLISLSFYFTGLFLGYEYYFWFNPEYKLVSEAINSIGLFSCIIGIIIVYEAEKNALISRVQKSSLEINLQNTQIKQKQEEILTMNSDLASKNTELRSVTELLRDKNTKMTDNLRYAQTIQAAILPSNEKMADMFADFFLLYRPKDIVSGDFYWIEDEVRGNNLRFLVVGDCTGHGVSGAFMSIIADSILNEIVLKKHIFQPHLILEEAHLLISQALQQDTTKNKDGIDLAICVIEPQEENFKVCFAGAKSRVLLSEPSKQEMKMVKGTNRSIGGYQRRKYKEFISEEFIVEKGSIIYMFSDGFADQNSPQNQKVGTARLLETINTIKELPFKKQKLMLEEMLEKHQGNKEQRDDITIMGCRL